MSSIEKTPRSILWLNFGGVLFLLLGALMSLLAAGNHKSMQLAGWLVVVFVGWFMVSIRVPITCPEKLFVFRLRDLIQLIVLTFVYVIMDVAPNIYARQLSIDSACKWVAGFWILFIGIGILVRVGARTGAKIAQG